jgi:Leucine-rich repeat (LRR) protein
MDLRDNALTALPRELGELQRLRTLDLRANPLRSLPD